MKTVKKRYLSPGFTLVEIMVSMVIALIVMGGVYRTLADEDIYHEQSEKILDMQNNARVALERIVRDVRRTGSLGCGGKLLANTLKNAVTTDTTFINQYTAGPPAWDGGQSILSSLITAAGSGTGVNFLSEVMGFNNNATAANTLYQVGTDAITLVYLSEERLVTAAGMGGPPTTATFNITANGFNQNDILYVTDCQDYSLFQKTNSDDTQAVTHAADTGINTASVDLKKDYGNLVPARVFSLNTATYFIHNDGEFELCRNDTGRQIASNIEDLQFEFLGDLSCGRDSLGVPIPCGNGDGNLADEDWQSSPAAFTTERPVRAVRIWVLAMSDIDTTHTDINNYDYPNSPYCSAAQAAAWAADTDPLTTCRSTGTPASLALASPPHSKYRHRYLASAVVYLRNAGLS